MAHEVAILKPRLARDRDTDHKVVLSGEATQEYLKCREQGDEERASVTGASFLDAVAQSLVETEYLPRSRKGPHGGAVSVEWQIERRSIIVVLAQPIVLVFAAFAPIRHLVPYVLAIGAHRRKCGFEPETVRTVGLSKIREQNARGPSVANNVARREDETLTTRRLKHELRTKERTYLEIERKIRLQLSRSCRSRRHVAQPSAWRDPQTAARPTPCQQHFVHGRRDRTWRGGFVPVHHHLERPLHRFWRNRPAQLQDKALVVRARCFVPELDRRPHLGLRRCERQRPEGPVCKWIEIDRD